MSGFFDMARSFNYHRRNRKPYRHLTAGQNGLEFAHVAKEEDRSMHCFCNYDIVRDLLIIHWTTQLTRSASAQLSLPSSASASLGALLSCTLPASPKPLRPATY